MGFKHVLLILNQLCKSFAANSNFKVNIKLESNMKAKITFLVIGTCAVLTGGCTVTSRPQLYPNEHLQQVGQAQADRDIADCMRHADSYVKEPEAYKKILKEGLLAGGVGAGAGALAGVIMKDSVGRATAAGAATGAVLALAKGLWEAGEKSPTYQRFVDYCLQQKGYGVIGWDTNRSLNM